MVVRIEEKGVRHDACHIEGHYPNGRFIPLRLDSLWLNFMQVFTWNQILVVTALLLLSSAWAIHLLGELR